MFNQYIYDIMIILFRWAIVNHNQRRSINRYLKIKKYY